MAASCDGCGGIVRRDRDEVVSRDEWYAHRAGTCPDCGQRVQWHRPIAGRLGPRDIARPSAPTMTRRPGSRPKFRHRANPQSVPKEEITTGLRTLNR
jgi:hypothetical protein